jgi:hypothetical protein
VPSELWLLILSLLDPKDAIAASCVCSEFRHVAPASAKRAIQRLWPHHSARVAAKIGATGVQKLLALIAQHESEAKGHPDVQKAIQVQKLVLPEHRQIAVEWLIEVRAGQTSPPSQHAAASSWRYLNCLRVLATAEIKRFRWSRLCLHFKFPSGVVHGA